MITLLPHQQEAVEQFRARKGKMLLFANPGVGKTYIAAEIIRRMRERMGVTIMLYLCPASTVEQTSRELEKYLGAAPNEVGIVVTNFEKLIVERFAKPWQQVDWDLIIIDECHFMNNATARRMRIFRTFKTKFKLAMSGTPFPNGLQECYSMINWLEPGLLGENWTEFKNEWCYVHPNHYVTGVRNKEKLRALIAPYIHRIEGDVIADDLPPVKQRQVFVELSDAHRQIFEATKRRMVIQLLEDDKLKKVRITNILSLISYLRQLVDCPNDLGVSEHLIVSPKIDALLHLVTYDRKPTIVFAEHKGAIEEIHNAFIEYKERVRTPCIGAIGIITGDVPMKERTQIVDAFQAGELDIIIGTSAMATGLNIQRATRVVHYSLPWNDAKIMQRTARAARYGQTQEVEEVYLLARNTMDTGSSKGVDMLALIEKKRELQQSFSRAELLKLIQ